MRLAELTFDNSFTSSLPGDPSTENRPRQVTGAAYSRVTPTPTEAPSLLSHSPEVLEMLDLGPEALDDTFTGGGFRIAPFVGRIRARRASGCAQNARSTNHSAPSGACRSAADHGPPLS